MDSYEHLVPVIITETFTAHEISLTDELAREYARRCLEGRDDIARPATWIRTRIRNHPEELAALAMPKAGPQGSPPKPPWCGECDRRTRLAETDDGRLRRCPVCHPLRGQQPTAPGPHPPVRDVIPRYAETKGQVLASYAEAEARRAAEYEAAQPPPVEPVQLALPDHDEPPAQPAVIDPDEWDAA
ncbi:MAG: hypothetical protein FWE35_10915 [Streptosporangiales bacterium]|nr:hypothetical protein [Streptosporangiales bacterium]